VIAAGCWAVGSRKDPDTGRRVMFVRYRQMAVDPEFEGRGLGSLLMEHVIESARKIGASEVVGNIRVDNVEWFKTFGYQVVGPGETLFGTIDNVSMSRPLP
jgi:ribosomal protein S18 acetylase RimI-like enzyme